MKLLRPVRSRRGFTMVEIALCLGIIGFALVAIIGVLPVGTNVQKENREDTIINQEGTYFMEAIRNGALGIDDLPVYVAKLTEVALDGSRQPAGRANPTGAQIIGLLSRPTDVVLKTEAEVWALSGPAASKSAKQTDFGFKYLLTAEVHPVSNIGTMDVPTDSPPELKLALDTQLGLLYEIRLTFRWPLLGSSGKTGNGRQVFRSLASGTFTRTNARGIVSTNGTFYYLLPATYDVPSSTP